MVVMFLSNVSIINFNADADNVKDQQLKIAVVNLAVLEKDSSISKDLFKKANAKRTEFDNKMLKKQHDVEKEIQKIDSSKAMLTTQEYERKRGMAIAQFQQEAYLETQKYEQISKMAQAYSLQEMQDVISKAVNKVAVGKYDLVLPTTVFLYMNSSKFDDITKEVINKTNSISKTINYEELFKKSEKEFQELLKQQQQKQQKKK